MCACLGLLCCLACSEPKLVAGDFRLTAGTGGFALYGPDGGALIDQATVSTRASRARFEMQYGAFRISEPGAPRWADGLDAKLTSDAVELYAADGTQVATVRIASPAEGVVALTLTAASPQANRVSLSWACRADDAFDGFGAQADALNHRGHTVPIWTSEAGIGKVTDGDDDSPLWPLVGARHASGYGLPTWLSNRGYLAALDFDGRSVFELCSKDPQRVRAEAWAGSVTLWFYTGAEPRQALERATAGLLGRPKRPPPVAFAPWNDAIFGADNVRRVALALRDAGVPSSVLWTEDFRGGTDNGDVYRLKEEWDTDEALYPDAGGLAAELDGLGFQWHAYFNSFLVAGTKVFNEGLDGGHFVGRDGGAPYLVSGTTFVPTGLADLSRAPTREWLKSYLRRALEHGYTGWMADFGEWLPADAVLASGEDPLLAHNRYPLEWDKLNAEVLGDDKVFFTRSGWFGSNEVTPVVWAGDQRTDFQADDGMPTIIPMGLGLGLGGVSTYGHDIAGYNSTGTVPSTREVFYRWTVLGALSPVMRTHHGLSARQNWRWDQDAETTDWYRRWATLHLRLFPYLDGASVEAETRGLPLMRALVLEFPNEDWSIADEYLLGPSLLVAPQVTAGPTRTVHVPQGRWVRLDGGVVDGPADLPGDPDSPVLLRAGAVIPLLPEGVQSLLGPLPARREVWVVPGAAGGFVERDGTTYSLAADGTLTVDGGPPRTYDVKRF
ncbi:MAG: hypothetical protein IPJ65_28225 [Archangiaceae bacterium]|nr:hypothetical protein [Archangiaceae bacterium]